jgi:quercetin dioxygenase-like cupin family protein
VAAGPYADAVPEVISEPSRIPVPGGKVIEEFVGRVATATPGVSVARMAAPPGWQEPAQVPEFDEVTLVLRGSVVVEHDDGVVEVRAGQAVLTRAGERVRYGVGPDGADYVAVCVPAFGPALVHREDDGEEDDGEEDDGEHVADPVG